MYQMMWNTMSSNLFANVSFATAEVEDEDAAEGVCPWVSVILPSSLAIDIGIEVFLLLQIVDFVVDAVDVVDVSVSEFVLSPPGEHLAFSGITHTPGVIVSSLLFLLSKVFLRFLIRQKRELILRMSFCPSFCTFLPKFRRCWADLQKSLCEEASRCFPHYRRIGWISRHILWCLRFPLSKALDALKTGWPDSVLIWSIIIAAVLSHFLFGFSEQVLYLVFSSPTPKKDQWPRWNLRAYFPTSTELWWHLFCGFLPT